MNDSICLIGLMLISQNIIIDERASLSLSSVVPGPLMGLLRSIRKVSMSLTSSFLTFVHGFNDFLRNMLKI